MAELGRLADTFQPLNLKRFLPGRFIVERAQKRKTELLETPEAMAARLNLYESSSTVERHVSG